MIDPGQVLADVAARVRQADEQAELGAAAYAAGPDTFERYLRAQQDQLIEQIEAIANGSPADTA